MDRDKLIVELSTLKIHQSMAGKDELGRYASKEQIADIADYILNRDERILKPIREVNAITGLQGRYIYMKAINETILAAEEI